MALKYPPTPGAREHSVTALYCYGVTWADAAARQDQGGLGGKDVVPVEFKGLAALTSSVPAAKVRARRADLLRHFDVLASAFERAAVVPLRFGTVFDDQASLVQKLLEPRHDELARLLDELRDRVELRITAHYRGEAILAEIVRQNRRVAHLREETMRGAGQPLLLELGELVSAELQARTARDRRMIIERLRPLSLQEDVDSEPIENQVLRASFLVDRRRLASFDHAMEDLASGQAGRIDFSYVGPVPPHSFVNLEGGG
jgi:hypothetical protein